MLAPLIAASVIAGPTVADYFPLVAGTRRSYEERARAVTVNVDEVGTPVDIAGKQAVPVTTTEGGKVISTTFYRIEGNTLFLVAVNKEHPLPSPIPIIQLSDGDRNKWSFYGPSDDGKLPEPVTMTGEAKVVGDRDVLGKKVSVLEVKLVTTVGGGRAQEKSEQTATYAKGIGLVRLVSKTSVGKQSVTTELRLVKIEEAKTDG